MLKPNFYPRAEKHMTEQGFTTFDLVGFIPMMLDEESEAPAQVQLDHGYAHGGGWRDAPPLLKYNDGVEPTLTYPGDPPIHPVAWWKLRDERIILFDHAWVAVVQPDGSARIARMD